MRLVIIVTYLDSPLWKESKSWPLEKIFKETPVRTVTIESDRILLLCQAESKAQHDVIWDIRNKTTPWLIDLANSAQYSSAQIYVAAHADMISFQELRREIPHARFRAGANFNHESGVSALYDRLIELVNKVDNESFEAVIECISQGQKQTYAQRLSTLKHRLAHVFLPISVDLHAWQECGFDDLYLQELRESYQTDEGRLDRARSLLYEESSVGDNVERLLSETGLEDDDAWAAIKLLLPPKSKDEEVERNQRDDYDMFLKAKAVLDSLKDRKKLMTLRSELRQENVFGAWCKELDKQLSQLVRHVDE